LLCRDGELGSQQRDLEHGFLFLFLVNEKGADFCGLSSRHGKKEALRP
jgi:hypothetical protein